MAARAEGNGRREVGRDIMGKFRVTGGRDIGRLAWRLKGTNGLPDRRPNVLPGPPTATTAAMPNRLAVFRASHPCVPARGRRDPAIRRSNDHPRHRLVRNQVFRDRHQRHHLPDRLRHRGDRHELRDAGLALPQSLFRQRPLHLGVADLDGARGTDRRLLHRRLAGRPPPLGHGARRNGADRLALHAGAAGLRPAHAGGGAGRDRRHQAGEVCSPRWHRPSRSRSSACTRRSRSG